jgi:hypothetical protein
VTAEGVNKLKQKLPKARIGIDPRPLRSPRRRRRASHCQA